MQDEPRPPIPARTDPVPVTPSPAPPPEIPPASALTPEEQMALFEKELKENDWGHQPC